ncbi:MAG: cartilage acidic protein, partial [Cyanobacteria bacterium J06607_17]
QLLLNQGNNTFLDVSDSSGLTNISSLTSDIATITWAIALVDYDLDGDLDVIHADDQAAIPSEAKGGGDHGYLQVFNNDGTGTFTNVTKAVNLDVTGSWMGLTFGDFNADGNLDLFATNLGDYTGSILPLAPDLVTSQWFLGQEDGTFLQADVGDLGATPFGWGASAFDYDNDSDTDIVFHGGLDAAFYIDASNPGVILQNDGAANFSYDLTALADSTDHGRRNVQGVAVGDLNQDGFPDIVSVSNFDTPEPIPVQPYPMPLNSPLDSLAGFIPTFLPTENPGEFVWSGLEFPDGTLSVELSSGDNGNHWVKVTPLGTVGLTQTGQVNRDGIGAVFSFTPTNGQTVLHPILGGASYASQDSLDAIFGLGQETTGVVEVLWPGGKRNRLYDVQAEEHLVFPEIPVSFDGDFEDVNDYQTQVDGAIADLIDANVLTEAEGDRFFASGVRAYLEANDLTVSLVMGEATDDMLVGNDTDEHLYGHGGDDTVAGGLGHDRIFGNDGDDVLRGDRNDRKSGGAVGGNDLIYGGNGNDRIGGKAGNDTLLGEAGDDQLWGDDGDDILRGGLGNDSLTGDDFSGGQGHDTFVLAIGEGTDTIVDFEMGEDSIGLADGLTFSQLILEGNEIRVEGEVLATLENVSTAELTATNFTVV